MSIQMEFENFHAANPQVLDELEDLALKWFRAGHNKVAIGMLWEVLRWRRGLLLIGVGDYKLNNNYRSRYARLLLNMHPEWITSIETRELRAA